MRRVHQRAGDIAAGQRHGEQVVGYYEITGQALGPDGRSDGLVSHVGLCYLQGIADADANADGGGKEDGGHPERPAQGEGHGPG